MSSTKPTSPVAARAAPPASRSNVVAWQGWRLALPARWNPVKLEGDFDAGYALFADFTRPRLGLRWQSARKHRGKPFDPAAWLARLMRAEVGTLAAAEAVASSGSRWPQSLLYVEPQPPGRDVWVGYSAASGRAVQVIYHARRRERILADVILPALADVSGDDPVPWSIFELSCRVPAGFVLALQRLNAGDLSLTFGEGRRQVTVRQIAVAELALQRLPLAGWLDRQQREHRKERRAAGEARAIVLEAGGRELSGLCRPSRRRRRFFWKWQVPRELFTVAVHDAERDRLVLLEASDESLARSVGASVAWAGDIS